MSKVFWEDWGTFKILCERCYEEIADQQWLGATGYQMTPQEKADQWKIAGQVLRNTHKCEECGCLVWIGNLTALVS